MFSKRVYCLKYDRQVNKVKRTTNEYRLTSQEHSTHLPSFHFSPLLRFFFSPSRHVSSLTLQIITRQLCYNTLKRAIISCVCCTIFPPEYRIKKWNTWYFQSIATKHSAMCISQECTTGMKQKTVKK
jgi:hypothetical protein